MNRLYEATTYIRQCLLQSEAIVQAVGENIFPCVANDDTKGDFIVVRRTQYERGRTKQGIFENAVLVEVAIISEHYDRTVELSRLVDEALEHDDAYPSYGSGLHLKLVGGEEGYDDHKYIQILEYELQIRNT